jgi:hypothetical protein
MPAVASPGSAEPRDKAAPANLEAIHCLFCNGGRSSLSLHDQTAWAFDPLSSPETNRMAELRAFLWPAKSAFLAPNRQNMVKKCR